MQNKGRKFLSDLKAYSDFLGWNEDLGRYETWEEATEEVFDTHRVKYAKQLPELEPYLDFALEKYKEKRFLASQRNLQFRGHDIFKHEFRMYNCLVMYADKPSWLGNAFYLSLCGCGVGVNMMLPFANRMPKIAKRTYGVKTYIIEDNIEGWANAAHALASSYIAKGYDVVEGFEEFQGYELKFDFSNIRKKGTRVGRRFKAPGHEGLKNSLDKIEEMLNKYLENTNEPQKFKTVLQYDFFMHLMNAVLSGGIRRAAASVIISYEDTDMLYAKSGNWRQNNKQRERSNNSVGLLRGTFTLNQFLELLKINQGTSDIGFVFMNNIFEIMNPCFEIGFTPLYYDWDNRPDITARIMQSDITVLDEGVRTAIQCCNLTEGNGAMCKTEQDFYDMCRAEAITGTLQAGYTNFGHIKDCLMETIAISKREALLGVSIAGIMNNPQILLNPEILRKGAEIVIKTNEEVANIIGINPAARLTCIKPGGNGPVLLMCSSGVTPEHSERYFRVMQLNKETETAKWLEEHMPFMIEESTYSENQTDYVVFVPIENNKNTLYKDTMKGVKHLEAVKLIMDNWVKPGKVESRCIIPTTSHNVSNTIIVGEEDYEDVANYLYENQNDFTAVSFMSPYGDKDWNQAPNTSVLTTAELLDRYGDAAIFASGLIVDALHDFNDNLWEACDYALNSDPKKEGFKKLIGHRREVLLKKDIIKRFKKFAKNYFKGDILEMIYCLKDVHLFHKWKTINRQFKEIDFTEILTKPNYIEIDSIGAAACAGGACEINR